jgi:hypothetical protein
VTDGRRLRAITDMVNVRHHFDQPGREEFHRRRLPHLDKIQVFNNNYHHA